MACQQGGLQIIDVSDQANPPFASGLATGLWAVNVTVKDGLAYVANNNLGMAIVDVHLPLTPTLITKAPCDYAKHVAVTNGLALVADYKDGLAAFDVSEPTNPRRMGAVSSLGNGEMVLLAGDLIHLVDGRGGLATFRLVTHNEPGFLSVLRQPRSTAVLAGQTATVQAKVVSAEPVALQWYCNDQPVPGANAEELTIPGVTVAQGGQYYLSASNSHGSTVSKSALLTVVESQAQLALEGQANGVAVQGHYAYVGGGSGLKVVDISDPASPVPVGSYTGGTQVRDVAVAGNLACVAFDDFIVGVHILDISDPIHPRKLSGSAIWTAPAEVFLNGRYLYSAGLNGTDAVDLTDPTTPLTLARLPTLSWAAGVCVDGPYAYVSDSGTGIQIFDVSNPLAMRRVGGLSTVGWTTCVSLQGGYAFAAEQTWGMAVVDVTDPQRPRWVNRVTFASNGAPQKLVAAGDLAFVACVADSGNNLQLVDVRDPERPQLAGSLSTGRRGCDLAISGGVVCLTDSDTGLSVFKIGRTSVAPTILEQPVGRLATPGESVALSVRAGGKGPWLYQWFANHIPMEGATNSTLDLGPMQPGKQANYSVQVRNSYGTVTSQAAEVFLAGPPQIAALPVCGRRRPAWPGVIAIGAGPLNYQWSKDGQPITDALNDPTLSGGQATLLDSGTYFVRVSNPYGYVDSEPFQVTVTLSWLDYLSSSPGGEFAIATQPDRAYLASGGSGLDIFDLAAPQNPNRIGGYDSDGDAHGLAVSGQRVYLADGVEGVKIIDVSFPWNPTLLGSFQTGGNVTDVALAGTLACAACGPAGLQLIDIGDSRNPGLVGVSGTPKAAVKVVTDGHYAYVADHDAGLQIIDISRPAEPSLVGAYKPSGAAVGIAQAQDRVYLAAEGVGLVILDVADRAHPRLLGTYSTSLAKAVAVAGNYVLLADWLGGTYLFDVTDPQTPLCLKRWGSGRYPESVALLGNLVCIGDGYLNVLTIDLKALAPLLLHQLQSVETPLHEDASFRVVTAGEAPLAYRWFFNGAAIPNATNTFLALHRVQPEDGGAY